MDTKVADLIASELPSLVFRTHPRLREIIGMHPRTLANLDSLGLGPDGRVMVNGRAAYPRDELVKWLLGRKKPACA